HRARQLSLRLVGERRSARRGARRQRHRRRQRGRHLRGGLLRQLHFDLIQRDDSSAMSNASTETTTALPEEGGLAASIGRSVFDGIDGAREIYGVLVRTLHYVVRAPTDRDAVVRQMYEIGNRSVFLLTVVIGFIGMIFVLQAGLQMQRVIPD